MFFRKKDPLPPEPEVYDEDEEYELMSDSELFVEAPPLVSNQLTFTLREVYDIDTDVLLESARDLPFEFRYYLDTRRAFSDALKSCRDEIAGYSDYTGGKSAVYDTEYEFDDHSVAIVFTLTRDNSALPFTFTADIRIDE